MKLETKTAIFNFKEDDKCYATVLAKYIDAHFCEAFNFFKLKFCGQKVEIDIIPTKQEYDKQFKKENNFSDDLVVSKSSRGCFLNGKILYLSINDYKNTTHAFEPDDFEHAFEDYKKTLMHEYVHFVNELFKQEHECGRTEKFLSEGIAIYLSHQKDNQEICFDFSCDDVLDYKHTNYNAYYLLTKYFVENYDRNFVLDILQSNRRSRKFLQKELFDKAKKCYIKNVTK